MSDINDFIIRDGVLDGYRGKDTCWVVPDSVTAIKSFLLGRDKVTDITLPNSVTLIDDFAFNRFLSLTSINIPDFVTSIGMYAFNECNSLKSIVLPDVVTDIGKCAFRDCNSLTTIALSRSLKSIGAYAFSGCKALDHITIPASVTSIGEFAFGGTELESIDVDEQNPAYLSIDGNLYTKDGKTLIKYAGGKMEESFIIPDSVTSIERFAFSGCTSLKSVTVPGSLTSIGDDTFLRCGSLVSITVPDSVTSIGDRAFYECGSLTDVLIPDTVTSIGDSAFFRCSSLKEISIPKTVTSIRDRTFSQCGSLKEVIIPETVTSIGVNSFWWSSSLEKVEILGSEVCILDGVFSGTSCIILAPKLPLKSFAKCRSELQAARGYLMNRQMFKDSPYDEEYQRYISSQSEIILPDLFKDDLVEALSVYGEIGWITEKNYEEEFFVPAQNAGAVKCVAYLLDWKNNNFSSEQMYKQFENELMKGLD